MRDCSFPSISEVSRVRAGFFPALAATALLIAGCAGSGSIPAPTAKNVEYAGRNGQVTTLAALKVGRSLYIGRCSSCHSLKAPAALTPADWPEMVQRMADNAKLTEDQERAITQYLVSVSGLAHDSTATPGPAPATAR